MEKKFLMVVALLWAVVFTSCSDKDDNGTRSQQEMEESIIGLWQEEFEYKDVTEDGKPFNRALIVVETKADHTAGITNHEVAVAVFFLRIIEWVRANYLFFRPTCR